MLCVRSFSYKYGNAGLNKYLIKQGPNLPFLLIETGCHSHMTVHDKIPGERRWARTYSQTRRDLDTARTIPATASNSAELPRPPAKRVWRGSGVEDLHDVAIEATSVMQHHTYRSSMNVTVPMFIWYHGQNSGRSP